ncbi:hypothetical protein EON63_17430 [archaeon]|nr:MAG: hypothetical protein EON63_17430 [archaeon]
MGNNRPVSGRSQGSGKGGKGPQGKRGPGRRGGDKKKSVNADDLDKEMDTCKYIGYSILWGFGHLLFHIPYKLLACTFADTYAYKYLPIFILIHVHTHIHTHAS